MATELSNQLEEMVVEEKISVASQWQLMWWRFRRHRLAGVAGIVLVLIYGIGLFAEFISPYDPNAVSNLHVYVPPQVPRFCGPDGFTLRPFVYGLERHRDPETRRVTYKRDRSTQYPLKFFVRGTPYRMWGIFKSDLHLFGTADPKQKVFILGSDRLGRDMFSRIVYGARVSTSIGLVGVFISVILGITIGGISGYYGGVIDSLVQRIIEFLRSIPTIPLWMGLSAALPMHWSPLKVYFGVVVILSLVGWTGLAREVRSKFISLREEDFVMAAKLVGATERRIIFRHMLPSFLSHIIASLTLAIPGMILGETSLSFLGLGLRPPAISWGVLLKEAQNVSTVALAPWLLLPGVAVIVTVLMFNFLGDGLRDAADPYGR